MRFIQKKTSKNNELEKIQQEIGATSAEFAAEKAEYVRLKASLPEAREDYLEGNDLLREGRIGTEAHASKQKSYQLTTRKMDACLNRMDNFATTMKKLVIASQPLAAAATAIVSQKTIANHISAPSALEYFVLHPIDYARLCEWIYEPTRAPDAPVTVLSKIDNATLTNHFFGRLFSTPSSKYIKILAQILFAYVRAKSPDGRAVNIMVIRGTDNLENAMTDVNIIMNAGYIEEFYKDMVRAVLREFEDKHGDCSFVTGHSLGGKLAEIVCERSNIIGITFNPLLNREAANMIAYRVNADAAELGVSHTDHWVRSVVPDIVSMAAWFIPFVPGLPLQGSVDHGIGKMVWGLKQDRTDWSSSDMEKVQAAYARKGLQI